VAAGALIYLVKPFVPADLAARLAGYARYRTILSGSNLSAQDVDAALDALRPRVAAQQTSVTATLAAAGEVKTRLRYGTTGRPEQEFVAAPEPTTPRVRRPPAGV
jgi:response regulator of citrate/malate metabolism